ncbi:helix-turn-helix domain-containing protein [Lysinibacillus xylanilyticus]|uniref:helix-turn-helix domain-containing protein n=1 Tax=Lysinibacillus xylanilyticus TaxID=582475 RepID=UPI003D053B16
MHKESSYTKQQVADYINVSTRTIYLWKTGKSPIRAASLYKLLTFYNVDMPISSIRTLIPQFEEMEG